MKFLLMKRLQLINKYFEEKRAGKLTSERVDNHRKHLARIEEMIRNDKH